jgi:hypothetical protein
MSSIYHQTAEDLFVYFHKNNSSSSSSSSSSPPVISLSFIEIAGDAVFDLLNSRQSTQLRTGNDGSVHPYPVIEPKVTTKEEMMQIIQYGLTIRSTAATGVNDSSSRSHAILKIYIQRTNEEEKKSKEGKEEKDGQIETENDSDDSEADEEKDKHKEKENNILEGTITLVDLAGSEQKIDSAHHDKERRRESSHINTSLMALKECIRARATATATNSTAPPLHQHVYRKSKLTMALKNSFHLPHARTIVIATVSPASKDTEHSLNTLRHACVMQGEGSGGGDEGSSAGGESRFITGGKMTTEQIGEVNIAKIAKKNFERKKSGANLTETTHHNVKSVAGHLFPEAEGAVVMDRNKKKADHSSLSFASLSPNAQEALLNSRMKLGKDERQLQRLQATNKATGNENNNNEEVEETVTSLKLDDVDLALSDALSTAVLSPSKSFIITGNNPFESTASPGSTTVSPGGTTLLKRRSSLPGGLTLNNSVSYITNGSKITGIVKTPTKLMESPSSKRLSFSAPVNDEELMKSIATALWKPLKEDASIPDTILFDQLKGVLRVLNYSEHMIEDFLAKQQQTLPFQANQQQQKSPQKSMGFSSAEKEKAKEKEREPLTESTANNNELKKNLKKTASVPVLKRKSTFSNLTSSIPPPPTASETADKTKQEAIAQYRVETEKLKIEEWAKSLSVGGSSGSGGGQAAQNNSMTAEENDQIAYHMREIQRLNNILEQDLLLTASRPSAEERLSTMQKFGIKKQLQTHKSGILKIQKRK